MMYPVLKKEREEAYQALSAVTVTNSLESEMRLFDYLAIMKEKGIQRAQQENKPYHIHGLCAIIGYSSEQKEHQLNFGFQVGKDLFAGAETSLDDPNAYSTLEKAMEEDGAILISSEGEMLHCGKRIRADESVYDENPEALATYEQLRRTADAGTRHFAVIAASVRFPELLFYTLKSDQPQIRIFKEGQIKYSTVPGEAAQKEQSEEPEKQYGDGKKRCKKGKDGSLRDSHFISSLSPTFSPA